MQTIKQYFLFTPKGNQFLGFFPEIKLSLLFFVHGDLPELVATTTSSTILKKENCTFLPWWKFVTKYVNFY